MTDDQAELIQKLAMSLDTCMEMVSAAARKEKREGAGKSLRPVTWQDREKSFGKLIDKARETLSDSGKVVWF